MEAPKTSETTTTMTAATMSKPFELPLTIEPEHELRFVGKLFQIKYLINIIVICKGATATAVAAAAAYRSDLQFVANTRKRP